MFELPLPITCVTGANGSGKTNLLDAVYYLCYTKSYLGSNQQNNVQAGTDGFRVSGVFRGDGADEVISCKWKAGKKEVSRNEVLYEKLTDHIGKFSAVMIAPDDTELINGGSESRRRWVDSILGQVDAVYLERLMLYQRILLQRNAWLKLNAFKPNPDYTELDFYDTQMLECGTYLHTNRAAFLVEFTPFMNEFYEKLSGGREAIGIAYLTDLDQKPMDRWLKDSLEHDIRMQRTLRGIHKDDWSFSINQMTLKQFGSQGQKKSFLFALKLGQYAYLTQKLGHLPILLLDDIFEKLDQQRMESLLSIICAESFGQVILSDTHPERIKKAFGESVNVDFIHLK